MSYLLYYNKIRYDFKEENNILEGETNRIDTTNYKQINATYHWYLIWDD